MASTTSQPAIGDGVTIHGWSDSHAYTVVQLIGTRGFIAQRDKATRTNGADDTITPGGFFAHREGTQEWSYETDPNGLTVKCMKRNTGKFYPIGATQAVSDGRHEHYDYNF